MAGYGLTPEIERRVAALRVERGDTVAIDEIAEVVANILGTLNGDMSVLDLRLYKELDDLAAYIRGAREEIAALCPEDIRQEHLPAATDQLDAIVKATEEATGTILDAAEKIEAEATRLEAATITDQVVRIYEACSFQDLTGQRISKVVTTLKHIEERLDRMVEVFGDEVRRRRNNAEPPKPDPTDERSLLNGPQLAGEGNRQEEIDALLASFD